MTNLFKGCKSWDEAKTLFRTLSKKMHPDLGGTHEQFIELVKQFENFTPTFSQENEFANAEFDKRRFADIVELLRELDDVTISFVGTFIWIEGNTYSQKDVIKALDLPNYNKARFASKKKAWYFSPIDYSKKNGKVYGMDEIKQMFGSQSYSQKKILITE